MAGEVTLRKRLSAQLKCCAQLRYCVWGFFLAHQRQRVDFCIVYVRLSEQGDERLGYIRSSNRKAVYSCAPGETH